MQSIFKRWGEWSKKTFPNQKVEGKINHLKREVDELNKSTEDGQADIIEIADCVGLLFAICEIEGVSYNQLKDAMNHKLDINIMREWPENSDSEGVYAHVETAKN